MGQHRLLIADSASDFRGALAERLRESYQIRSCADGKEALRLLEEFQPELMILDLMLPGLDGISLMHEPIFRKLRPQVLATTRFSSDYVLKSIDRMGVSYLIMKPCEIRAVVDRIEELSSHCVHQNAEPSDLRKLTVSHLCALGVSSKLNGYLYLQEAIPLCAEAPDQLITKELYPAVADRFKTGPSHVERSIRNAIDKAWSQADPQVWRLYFLCDKLGIVSKPSNAQFISRLADCLRLNMPAPGEV